MTARDFAPSSGERTTATASNTFRQVAFLEKEVAMHLEPRCSHCGSEDPKIISLRNPERERYCGRDCLARGHENFIRWLRGAKVETAS